MWWLVTFTVCLQQEGNLRGLRLRRRSQNKGFLRRMGACLGHRLDWLLWWLWRSTPGASPWTSRLHPEEKKCEHKNDKSKHFDLDFFLRNSLKIKTYKIKKKTVTESMSLQTYHNIILGIPSLSSSISRTMAFLNKTSYKTNMKLLDTFCWLTTKSLPRNSVS